MTRRTWWLLFIVALLYLPIEFFERRWGEYFLVLSFAAHLMCDYDLVAKG